MLWWEGVRRYFTRIPEARRVEAWLEIPYVYRGELFYVRIPYRRGPIPHWEGWVEDDLGNPGVIRCTEKVRPYAGPFWDFSGFPECTPAMLGLGDVVLRNPVTHEVKNVPRHSRLI